MNTNVDKAIFGEDSTFMHVEPAALRDRDIAVYRSTLILQYEFGKD